MKFNVVEWNGLKWNDVECMEQSEVECCGVEQSEVECCEVGHRGRALQVYLRLWQKSDP